MTEESTLHLLLRITYFLICHEGYFTVDYTRLQLLVLVFHVIAFPLTSNAIFIYTIVIYTYTI